MQPHENEDTQYDPIPELEVTGITHETRCEHVFVEDPDQDPNTNMISVRCVNEGCWSGASYDPAQTTLIDGKLVSKED